MGSRRDKLRKRTRRAAINHNTKGGSRVIDWQKAGVQKPVFFEPTVGRSALNEIDILPFVVTQEWYKDLHTFYGSPTGLDIGEWDYKLEIPIHRGVGPSKSWHLCLREAFQQPCPTCEAREEELNKNNPDEDLIKQLKVSWRTVYNVYNYSKPNDDNHFWEVSYHLFEKMVLAEIDATPEPGEEGVDIFWDPEEGKTITFRGYEKKLGKNSFVEAQAIEFEDRDPYSEDIIKETVSLDKALVIPTYDEIVTMLTGVSGAQESEKPSRTRGKSRTRSKGKKNSECPEDYQFGKEWNDYPECENCEPEVFAACQEAYQDNIKDDEPEEQNEPAEEKSSRRSRGRSEKTSRRSRRRR